LLRWCSHGWLETGRRARPSSLPVGFRAADVRAERADVVDRVVLADRVVRPGSAERVDLAADLVDVDLVDDLVDGLAAVPDVLGGTDSPLSPRGADVSSTARQMAHAPGGCRQNGSAAPAAPGT